MKCVVVQVVQGEFVVCRMVRLSTLIGCQPKTRNQAKYRVSINDLVLSIVLVLE